MRSPNANPRSPAVTTSTKAAKKLSSVVNSTHHQYSDREARPSKVAYFEKQADIESVSVMNLSSLVVDSRLGYCCMTSKGREWNVVSLLSQGAKQRLVIFD